MLTISHVKNRDKPKHLNVSLFSKSLFSSWGGPKAGGIWSPLPLGPCFFYFQCSHTRLCCSGTFQVSSQQRASGLVWSAGTLCYLQVCTRSPWVSIPWVFLYLTLATPPAALLPTSLSVSLLCFPCIRMFCLHIHLHTRMGTRSMGL